MRLASETFEAASPIISMSLTIANITKRLVPSEARSISLANAIASTDRHEWLIGLMEGVEDIPGAALAAGIQWGWESFAEYLNVVDAVPKAIDVGTQVPHGAVRGYVMGERGARNEPATEADIAAMAAIVRAASTPARSASRPPALWRIAPSTASRCRAPSRPRTSCSASVGCSASWASACSSWRPPARSGEDLDGADREMAWIVKLAEAIRRPVTFVLSQNNVAPNDWRRMLDLAGDADAAGVAVRPQVHGRTTSLLLGLQTFHPFNFTPAWSEVGLLPLDRAGPAG